MGALHDIEPPRFLAATRREEAEHEAALIDRDSAEQIARDADDGDTDWFSDWLVGECFGRRLSPNQVDGIRHMSAMSADLGAHAIKSTLWDVPALLTLARLNVPWCALAMGEIERRFGVHRDRVAAGLRATELPA